MVRDNVRIVFINASSINYHVQIAERSEFWLDEMKERWKQRRILTILNVITGSINVMSSEGNKKEILKIKEYRLYQKKIILLLDTLMGLVIKSDERF